MSLTIFSDYIGYLILWMIPIVSLFKIGLMLRRVVQTSSGRLIDTKDCRLEEKVRLDQASFHAVMGVEPMKIYESWNPHYAYASGENLIRNQAVFIVVPGLDLIDYEALQWLYKREFYYIVNHVLIKIQMIKFFGMAIAAIILSMMMACSFSVCIFGTILIGGCLESVCRHIAEHRADSFVQEYALVEELKGGLRFLIAAYREDKKASIIQRFIKIRLRPTYFFRLRRQSKALARMNALEVVEEDKIAKLRALFEKNNLEELAFIEAKKQQVLRWIDADED